MGLSILVVDAFAEGPFTGNPAAVCLLDEPCSGTAGELWMQRLAAEMRHSETAFVSARAGGGGCEFDLRWFTPACEVELCGHATLAATWSLVESGRAARGVTLRFHTLSGVLTARADGGLVELDFPARPATARAAPEGLLEALGIAEAVATAAAKEDWLVELESEAAVRALRPDYRALRAVECRGVIATARGAEHDVVSRFFAPRAGVDEDPVTGSAHCTLAPWWTARIEARELRCWQASERGGLVRCEVVGERVLLRGRAVTVLRGEVLAGP